MNKESKKKASIMITALILFTFISTILLVIYVYSSNNFKQAKRQEENLHAYFLSYSGCELAYSALLDEFRALGPSAKWENFVAEFADSTSSTVQNHKMIISLDSKFTESGYQATDIISESGGTADKSLLRDFQDSCILVSVSLVPLSTTDEGEKDYKGYLRVEAIGKTGIGTTFPGYSKQYLYVDPKNVDKVYWR